MSVVIGDDVVVHLVVFVYVQMMVKYLKSHHTCVSSDRGDSWDSTQFPNAEEIV